jgi:PAS domain S-box-containing protein
MPTNIQKAYSRLIITLLMANSLVSALGYGILMLANPGYHLLARFIGSLIFVPVFGSLFFLLKSGHDRMARAIAITLNFGLILTQVWIDGGVHSPNFFTLLVGASLAILAYGLPGLIVTTVISLTAGYAFAYWQTAPYTYSLSETMVSEFSSFATIAFYFYFSLRMYRQELANNQQTEEKFRAIIEQASEAIFLIDEEGKIIQANKATELITGLKANEILGQPAWEVQERLTPPELRSRTRVEQQRQVLLDGIRANISFAPPAQQEVVLLRPDGQRRIILNSIFFIKLQVGMRVCSFMTDITARKQVEERLKEQQALSLATEQTRRKTLETIERISMNLRRTKEKHSYYGTLLKSCTQFLGALAGMVFEIVEGAPAFVKSEALEWNALDAALKELLLNRLSEFSSAPETISIAQFPNSQQAWVLVKLPSESALVGFLVLKWRSPHLADDERTILETIAEITGIALDRMRVLETLEERVKHRTRELRVLYDMMQLYVSHDNIDFVIKESLKILLHSIRADGYVFFLVERDTQQLRMVSAAGPGLENANEQELYDPAELGWGAILASDKPIIRIEPLFPFQRAEEGLRPANHFLGVPVRGENGLLAGMGFFYDQDVALALEEFNLINLFADQIGMVIERNILRQQVKNAAVIEERERLSRELHDSLTQSLYSLKLIADASRRLAKQQKWDEVNNQLDAIYEIAMQALKEMRLLIYELVPDSIEQLGLVAALEQRLNFVERRAGVQVEFHYEGELSLPIATQVGLYRIAQEALNNAAKHAEATKIELSLTCIENRLSLQICDNGKGFDLNNISPGMGLGSMQERVQRLGGELIISSHLGGGTVVRCTFGEKPV